MTQGDKAAFNDGGDRNLYVNSISYDGSVVKNTTTPIYTSPLFGRTAPTTRATRCSPSPTPPRCRPAPSTPTTTPAAVSVGTGADTLTLMMSEDPYQGDAQFTVSVDGKQVGGTLTTTAISWEGQTQEFDLHGAWGSGKHTVVVSYTNDASGMKDANGNTYDAQDRNLYINKISYDGTAAAGTPWELASTGSQSFSVSGTTPAATAATAAAKTASIVVYPSTGGAQTSTPPPPAPPPSAATRSPSSATAWRARCWVPRWRRSASSACRA